MVDMLRIGNASGYWGDDLDALARQIDGGPIDVVTMDFLAEITMSILQKQVDRNPAAGFARDFVDQMRGVMAAATERGVKIITNAGGVRPRACAEAIIAVGAELGLDPRVAMVAGDDLMADLASWQEAGIDLSNMDDGRRFSEVHDRVTSANAYFGAAPVVRALELGAQFIVTGRVTDTGLTVAPMIHHFGWDPHDWDRIASGTIAGHILECGAQSTGGNYTDWRDVSSFHDIGYPIVEVDEDGSFVVTKHEGTGGLVSVETVKEQLVYEMGDPKAYLTPDVVVDFTSIQLESDGPDRVRVSGLRGAPPTDLLKVSMSYEDGVKASGACMVSGPEARAKAESFSEILWHRLPTYEAKLTEYVGQDATWGRLAPAQEPSELYVRFGVRDHDPAKVREFSKTLMAMLLSGPPGVAATGGRPPVQDVVAYWPCLVPRSLCQAEIAVLGGGPEVSESMLFEGPTGDGSVGGPIPELSADTVALTGESVTVPLREIAHGRSGDKGDTCNIGIIARDPRIYPLLVDTLTTERVKSEFEGIAHGSVERFEVPNIWALNFLLHESLGGGGTLSLHIDAQGKTLSHALLSVEVDVDRAYLELLGA
ncbi:MAG: acyclic terpene utilization AtuA family protein [Acidimicrobiales bacterium]